VQDFVLKCAKSILSAYVVELVDDRLDHGILVGKDRGNEVLVWPVALAEIQMGDVPGKREALRDFIVVLGLWWGDGGAGDFRVGEVVVVELQLVGYYAYCAVLLKVAQLRGPRCSICLVSGLSTSICYGPSRVCDSPV